MTDVVGRGDFDIGADTTRLKGDMAGAGRIVKQAGTQVESSFGKQAAAGIGQAEKQARTLRGTLSGMVRSPDIKKGILGGLGIGAGFGVAMVLQQTIGAVVSLVGDAIKAAAEEAAQMAQLTAAIKANDEAWDGNLDTVEEVIRQRQALAFADDKQRDALQTLIGFTKDLSEAQRLSLVAMDLARFKHIELAQAAVLVGKTYNGSFTAVKKLGIVLKEGATAAEAVAEIQKVVAGQAQAYAESDLGKMERAQISINNLMEDFGTIILPLVGDAALMVSAGVEAIAAHVANLVENITKARDILEGLRDTVHQTVGRDIENDLANMGRIGATMGTVLVSDFAGNSGFALEDLQRIIQDTGEEMGLLHADVVLLGTDAERATLVTGALGGGLEAVGEHADVAGDRLEALSEQAEALADDAARAVRFSDRLADAMDAVANTSLEGAREEFRSVMKAAEQAAKDETWSALNRQFKRLQAARRAYVRAGEFDSAAIIDAGIRENRELVKKARLSSLAYRAEAGDRGAIRQLNKQGITDVAALARAVRTGNRQQQTALQRTADEVGDVTKEIETLRAEAEEGVTVDVDVQTAALDALEARLAELAGRGQIATPDMGFPRTPYRRPRGGPSTNPPPPPGRSGRASGGATVNLTVNGHPTRARTPGEIVRHLRAAGRNGVFEPQRGVQWS